MSELAASTAPPCLGVVLVTYNSAGIILDCLESLLASTGVRLVLQVVDNASTDGTPSVIRDWAAGRAAAPLADLPFAVPLAPKPLPIALPQAVPPSGHVLGLIETGENLGFAGGVNRGLAALAIMSEVDRFWILNPDTVVPPGSAHAFATHPEPAGGFSLMGGRVLYLDRPDMIQIDGGTINRWTGITNNLSLFASHAATPPPDAATMDFITGASMVASRRFCEVAGPMAEDYFLYYEEVDWALRRGALPLLYCPGGLVYHRAGTAIGSATANRLASPFALWFKNRARMMFMRRHFPLGIVTAWAWTIGKVGQYLVKGYHSGAAALLAGAAGRPPPAAVRQVLSATVLTRLGLWPYSDHGGRR